MSGSLNERDQDAVNGLIRSLDRAESGGVVVLSSVTLAEELGKLRTDPLALGLLGLMYLAFIMALALSVVGLLTYSGLTAQSRRTEFGVLRALGLSSLRVVGGLALEQLFVMITGVMLGALLGWVLASQVVPTLALGAAGEGDHAAVCDARGSPPPAGIRPADGGRAAAGAEFEPAAGAAVVAGAHAAVGGRVE